MSAPTESSPSARLDKWLWALRLFKTRPLATAACKAGFVCVNELAAKPARDVHPGERITVKQGVILRRLVVLGAPKSRVSAKQVAEYCEDHTPPEEYEKARVLRVQHLLEREKGTGRPTKRDRRLIDDLLGGDE